MTILRKSAAGVLAGLLAAGPALARPLPPEPPQGGIEYLSAYLELQASIGGPEAPAAEATPRPVFRASRRDLPASRWGVGLPLISFGATTLVASGGAAAVAGGVAAVFAGVAVVLRGLPLSAGTPFVSPWPPPRRGPPSP